MRIPIMGAGKTGEASWQALRYQSGKDRTEKLLRVNGASLRFHPLHVWSHIRPSQRLEPEKKHHPVCLYFCLCGSHETPGRTGDYLQTPYELSHTNKKERK